MVNHIFTPFSVKLKIVLDIIFQWLVWGIQIH